MNTYSLILASGNGLRLPNKEKLPKQFLKIQEIEILFLTIKQFINSPLINHTIVVVSPGWIDYTRKILAPFLYENKNIAITTGDDDRQGSLLKGLHFIYQNYDIHTDDIILTHDGVRPFISQEIIKENIDVLLDGALGVDTVIPSNDTIVHSINGKQIDAVPPRDRLYRGQTPQSFNLQLLYDLLRDMNLKTRLALTDAAKILVEHNIPVTMVNGSQFNIKITTPEELIIAQYFYTFLKEQIANGECHATYYL